MIELHRSKGVDSVDTIHRLGLGACIQRAVFMLLSVAALSGPGLVWGQAPVAPEPVLGEPAAVNVGELPSAPGGLSYATFDVLTLQRDNGVINNPLITDTPFGPTLLSAGDLRPTTALGSRLFVGQRFADGWGREVGYLGVYGMTAISTLTGDGNLAIAGPISEPVLPFQDANVARVTDVSSINSIELNAFRSRCGPEGCVDLLVGFRYLNFSDQAGITMTCCNDVPGGPYTSSYSAQTANNLFGGQIGARGRREWDRWALEGWAKAGVYGNAEFQSQQPIYDPIGSGTLVRGSRSRWGGETAFIGDLNASLIYRLSRVWGVRAGYNLIWIDGVALAPNQWDFSNFDTSGTALVGGGGLFLCGANLGLEARW